MQSGQVCFFWCPSPCFTNCLLTDESDCTEHKDDPWVSKVLTFPTSAAPPNSDVTHNIPMNAMLREQLQVLLSAEGQEMLHIYTQVDTVSSISAQPWKEALTSGTPHTLGDPQDTDPHGGSSQAITK